MYNVTNKIYRNSKKYSLYSIKFRIIYNYELAYNFSITLIF